MAFVAIKKYRSGYVQPFVFAAIAVFISTLTTKQHVIYDVVAGVALVEVTYRVSKLID